MGHLICCIEFAQEYVPADSVQDNMVISEDEGVIPGPMRDESSLQTRVYEVSNASYVHVAYDAPATYLECTSVFQIPDSRFKFLPLTLHVLLAVGVDMLEDLIWGR